MLALRYVLLFLSGYFVGEIFSQDVRLGVYALASVAAVYIVGIIRHQ